MATLTIRHFGGLRLSSHNSQCPLPPEFPRSLFSYLSCHPDRVFCRDFLSGRLWPDLPGARARRALSTALWRLRRSPLVASCLNVPSRDTVSFRVPCRIWIDTVAFERHVSRATKLARSDPGRALHPATRAVAIYEATAFSDLPDDWALDERTRLENLWCDALFLAARLNLERGRFGKAGRLAARLAQIEPFREDVRRIEVSAALMAGNRAQARHLFDSFTRFLHRELNVTPGFTLREMGRTLPTPAQPEAGSLPAQAIIDLRCALRRFDSRLAAVQQARGGPNDCVSGKT